MKKTFELKYILNNMGCYMEKDCLSYQIEVLFKDISINNNVSILDIFNQKVIPFKDRCWFLIKSCELSRHQKIELSIGWAEIVLCVFEKYKNNDRRPHKAIQAVKDYLKAYADADAADAADDAAHAAYAADAAHAAYAAAAAAADAYAAYNSAIAAAGNNKTLSKALENFTIEYIKKLL